MDSFHLRAAEDDLGRKSCAEATITWKRLSDESLKDTTLARGLIADHDNLRQIDQLTNSTSKEFVDFIQHQRVR
jgi:hypothetical protein